MLERLSIRDFAVARTVVIEPGAGLNVFTGETGAGKSLVVDALAFVFGARRGREVIASGAEKAAVEATLALPEGRLTIERVISLGGRSTARVDGRPATLDELQSLAARLVDIHGQSDQLAILRTSVQTAVLDQFAGLGAFQHEVALLVRELRETRRNLRTLATDARERERLIDQLRFEVNEIVAAELRPGEDDALRAEVQRLGNVSRLLEDALVASEALDADALGAAVRAIGDLAARDPAAGELSDMAAALETTISDLSRALRLYRDSLEEDPERLRVVEARLDLLARLRRKYGESLGDVIAYGADAEARLASLTSAGATVEGLREKEAGLVSTLAARASELSLARRASAGDLVRAIAAELEHLGMGRAALSVGFACEDDEEGLPVALPDYEVVITERPPSDGDAPLSRAFSETGVDRVEFLAAFNAGETPRPLATVASGGETSRFLLALTTVLGAGAEPRLVVFDEVDEGVGGRAGGMVGEALARLAGRHQVLCVTHLPQVAAHGAHHFVVTKHSDGTRTHSEVRAVAGDERVEELAAMLGTVSEATREAARELVAQANAAARPRA
ncbi:MAG: DNA repair protein RecN [Dehalococcoidia bacterium]